MQPHLIEAGLGRGAQFALGPVLKPIVVAIDPVLCIGGHDCDVIARMQVLAFPYHPERGPDNGLRRSEYLREGLLWRDRREDRVDIACAVRCQTDFGLREVVLSRRMDRHDIIAERQIGGEGICGARPHHVESGVRDFPNHLAGQKGNIQWHRRLVPDRFVADLPASEIGGEGEGSRRWRGGDFTQCVGQFAGVVSGQEAAAGLLGDTLHLHQRLSLAPDVEADDVGGEVHAGRLQRAGGSAGIGVAGFDAVRDEDHGCRLFGMAQRLGSGDDSIGHRGHAARVQFVNDPGNLVGGARRRRNNGLDIRALSALAVAVGDEAEILVCGEIRQDVGHHLTGDGDLVHPVDLAPHRPRSIQHEDRVLAFLGERRRCKG